MSDTRTQIFVWQVALAAVGGAIIAVLWELPSTERGFFYDLTWGLAAGFFWGVVGLLAVALVAVIVWVIIRMVGGGSADSGDAMAADMDSMAGSATVGSISGWIDSYTSSGVLMAAKWGVGSLLLWAMAGGWIWGFEIGHDGVRLLIIVLFGVIGGAIASSVYQHGTQRFGGEPGDAPMAEVQWLWDSTGLSGIEIWAILSAGALGVGGLLAAGGLSGSGILVAIVLAGVALVATLVGGFAGIGFRRSMFIPAEA